MPLAGSLLQYRLPDVLRVIESGQRGGRLTIRRGERGAGNLLLRRPVAALRAHRLGEGARPSPGAGRLHHPATVRGDDGGAVHRGWPDS